MNDNFPIYKSRADLEKLLAEGAIESTTLEFKSSAALARDEKKITDMCIDVSAMANSAGGQIIYGIDEAKKTKGPVVVDSGVSDPTITREWIGQILNSRLQPRLDTYRIDSIDMGAGKLGFAISVPQTQTGARQAPDKRYYKRFELEVRAMEDYELKDVMRRSSAPFLEVNLALAGGKHSAFGLKSGQGVSDPFPLFFSIENKSEAPALYTLLTVGLDSRIIMRDYEGVTAVGKATDYDGQQLGWYERRFAVPHDLPIFKEASYTTPDARLQLCVPVDAFAQYMIRIRIQTPGFSSTKDWTLQQMGTRLEVYSDRDD